MRYRLVKIAGSPNWYVQWFEGRHSRRVTTRTRRDDEAAAFLAAFTLAHPEQPTEAVTLAEVLDWYMNTRGAELARPDNAAGAIKNLKAVFGSTLAADVNLAKQQAYAERRRATVGDETIRRELSVLSAAMRRAAAHDKIARAPAILSIPKAKARERWITRNEAAALFRYLRSQPRARHLLIFTRLALYTGARTGAILDLTWDRVDLERAEIDYDVPRRRQTNKRRPLVPLELNMVLALRGERRRAERRDKRLERPLVPYVVQWKGRRCARIVRGFKRHAKAAGLGEDVTPHTLRHSYATWAAMAGAPLFLIGRSMGQSIISTTERYAKHQPDALRQVTRAVRRKKGAT